MSKRKNNLLIQNARLKAYQSLLNCKGIHPEGLKNIQEWISIIQEQKRTGNDGGGISLIQVCGPWLEVRIHLSSQQIRSSVHFPVLSPLPQTVPEALSNLEEAQSLLQTIPQIEQIYLDALQEMESP